MARLESSPSTSIKTKRRRRRRTTPQQLFARRMSQGIIVFLALCVLVLVYLFVSVQRVAALSGQSTAGLRGTHHTWVATNAKPFNEDNAASNARNLIVVAGHSVVVAGNLEDAEWDEDVWYLLDYQVGQGLPQAIVGHIRAGIQEAVRDPSALLIFSGGETRGPMGPANEGLSYYRVADAMNLWTDGDKTSNVRARTTTEEFATDSFQNLEFSICRFKEVTGYYPDKITMVSFTFKQQRFEGMHSKALRWPTSRFSYIGVDPPASTGFNLEQSTQSEKEKAAKPFEDDPYGCFTPVLQQKREERNPFGRTAPYPLSCPDMTQLLSWCGPDLISEASVPWTKR